MQPIPFGKYVLINRLAVGGMAEVYRAKLRGVAGFERIVAIKRILPSVAEDKEFIDMFLDEARIAGQLNHANICPIYELGRIGPTYYIAMEYVDGKDVLQTINRFRRRRAYMPPVMAAWIGVRICEALAYAHNKTSTDNKPLDIIHRDVSPQNILISYEGTVKLIDFGISKASSRITRTQAGVLKGKFGYMSPEQIKGMPIDHRSDLFALGTCLYEMVTSDRLFKAASDFATLEKIRAAEIPPPSSVVENFPPMLDAAIMRALEVEPSNRWQSAQDMAKELRDFIASQEPFGTSTLSSWMKSCFAKELQEETEQVRKWSQARDSSPEAPQSHALEGHIPDHTPEIAPSDHPGDATVVQSSEFDISGTQPPIDHQSTHIFFHREFEEGETTGIAEQPTIIHAEFADTTSPQSPAPLEQPLALELPQAPVQPALLPTIEPQTTGALSKWKYGLVMVGLILLLLGLGAAAGYVLGSIL